MGTRHEHQLHEPAPVQAHGHAHPDTGAHRHPHHHAADAAGGHDHAHTLRFERWTYLVSPVHGLDPRIKVVASLAIVLGFVAGPAPQPIEFVLTVAALLAVTLIARVPVRWMLARSAVVLPIALSIAVFAPLGRATALSWPAVQEAYATYGWLVWSIAAKAWVSAYVALLLSATTPMPSLFKGLRALHMPQIFLTMLSFLYRFADVLGSQLASTRRAVASRGPALSGLALVRLYGNLAGNLFIRSYSRGERIYSAMVSRGYDGTLPTAETLATRPVDWLVLFTAVMASAALLLY